MKKLLIFFSFLLSSAMAFSQSESHKPKTINLTISEFSGNGPLDASRYAYAWNVRITIPDTTDASPRPSIWSIPGAGEAGTDTSKLTLYGPHYWLKNGWDGSVVLGNGIHYPVLITLQPNAQNPRPWHTQAIMDTLFIRYPQILRSSVHTAGLSQGSYDFQNVIIYASSLSTNDTSMKMIKSYVDLQGVEGEVFNNGAGTNYTTYGQPQAFGYWAKHYGGRMWGLEGTNDPRNVWHQTQNMNDSLAGSAYFAYTNYQGGTHGGTSGQLWNWAYNPANTDWQCVNPITNVNLVNGSPANTMGNYYKPASVFQWMLRQGDTTLVNNSAPTTYTTNPGSNLVAAGEYVTTWLDNSGLVYTIGGNTNLLGTGGAGIRGGANRINAPSNLKFNMVTPILHGGCALDTTGSVWCWGGNAQGTTGTGSFTDPLLSATKITVDSRGIPLTTVSLIQGTYAANQAEGLYIVKHGTLSDTLFMCGDTRFGLRGDGTAGDTASRPEMVWPLPSGKRFIQLAAEKYGVALLSDGTLYTTGGSASVGNPPNYARLGYAGSGNQYLTWHQVTGFDDSVRQIAGGDDMGTLALTKTGRLYGWGAFSDYLGNTAGGAYTTPHDLTLDILNYIPSGIKKITTNSNCFHALANNGKLYGWGDNLMGSIGNGVEPDYSQGPNYYFGDPSALHVLMQIHPVQVTNRSDYVSVFSDPLFGFNVFAFDATGQMYNAGRNKGAIAGNGVIECSYTGPNSGVQSANFPNAWDVPYLTPISPKLVSGPIPTICPRCVTNPTATNCNGICTVPSTTLTANAGGAQTLPSGTTTTQLNATGSTCIGGTINYYLWSQLSGPTQAVFDVISSPKPNLSGLVNGIYTFQVKVTDNAWSTSTATVVVTISNSTPPTVSAGNTIVIYSPLSSTTLFGTASGNNGATITSTVWSQVSGPNTATINTPGSLITNVNGMIQGHYVFKLTATDSNNQSSSANVDVYVMPPAYWIIHQKWYHRIYLVQ